jgi:hypothetical protein
VRFGQVLAEVREFLGYVPHQVNDPFRHFENPAGGKVSVATYMSALDELEAQVEGQQRPLTGTAVAPRSQKKM